MAYQIIFSDMDGTLLEDDIHISEKNQEAIAKAVAAGKEMVLCTGRGVFGTEVILEHLGLGQKGYVITQNGGAVYHLETMKLAWKKGFSPKEYAKYAKLAEEMGLEVYFYDNRKFMATHFTKEVENYCAVMGTEAIILTDYENYDGVFTKSLINGKKITFGSPRSFNERNGYGWILSSPVIIIWKWFCVV
ncbi:HAD-IIB family hydrolase [Chakrabartyella piscis]|uniref:HAD-IIB family hydrolase n=1 Tax=Chakrabartyella piscis TaxID=2918914 RepID=UPI002958C60A|nr:HAD-IIB family hydrolase [Chakrabartyella piscis]